VYPLYCTLYFCTLTRQQPSALVALSSTLVSDFLFQILQCTLHWLQLSQHFLLAISLRNQQFSQNSYFLLEVSRELPQRSTLNTFFVALSFLVVRLHSFNPVCSYIFVCVTFQPIDFCSVPNLPHLCQFVHSFALKWLPIFIVRETSAQQTFGLYQLFPTLQT
jgi:hypothetical protein